jgi:hypothetical protein
MDFLEHYFTEALSDDLMSLQRYLQASDVDKALFRAEENPYLIRKYLEIEDIENEIFNDMEDYDIVDWLIENDPEVAIDYGEFLVGERDYYNNSTPQLYDIVTFIKFVRNSWIIHFTDAASDIHKDQNFKIGVPYDEYEKLALTTHFKDSFKTGGFNFGYEIGDVEKYAFQRGRPKYGNEAVLFRGDGVKVHHSGDEEPQVIFDGKQTFKPIIHIQYNKDSGAWLIKSNKTGEKIIEKDKITDIANWVDTNYSQYINHLEPKK